MVGCDRNVVALQQMDSRSVVCVAPTCNRPPDDQLEKVNGGLMMESEGLNGIEPWPSAKTVQPSWCGRRDLNPHAIGMTQDFKSWVSADSTTPA